MPEVEEVFRLATNRVKPDPNALERQQRRQRSAARSSRVRVYVAVAAVIAAVAVGAVVVLEAVNSRDKIPVDNGSGTPGQLTFANALPAGAIEQELDVIDLQGRTTRRVVGLPLDGFAPSVSADGSTIAFVAVPNEMAYNQIGIMNADGSAPHFVPTPHVVVTTVAVSPDGSRIAFEGIASGNGDIYVVRSDGSGLQQLTDDPASSRNGHPTERPSCTTTRATGSRVTRNTR